MSASAPLSCDSASKAAWSTSGLLNSTNTVSAFTRAPGKIRIRSTRPALIVGIQSISSGTSVPLPRTFRSIGFSLVARLTVSGQAFSTSGAAGLSRERPMVITTNAPRPAAE